MKIIATMIIKDEEKNLPRCLDSIKDFVDEIVVVDTGSTDRSIEIMESYGAHVYHQPWQNDFSFHRNYSIEKALKHGADWFLIIDGDEELQKMDVTPEEFKERLTMIHDEVSALVVQVHEFREGESVLPFTGTRFFRAGRNFHYENIAHNRPRIEGASGATDIVMYHYGYSDPETMNQKWKRTLPLLDKRLEEDPDDYNAMFYRCVTRIGLYDTKEGIESGIQDGIRCLELMPEQDSTKLGYYGKLYYVIGWAYLRINDADHAYIWFKKGLEFYPHDVDLNFSFAQLGYICKENDMLKQYAKGYFDALERYRNGLKPKFKGFYTGMQREDMPIPVRHIHNATKNSDKSVRKWLEIEGL